MTDTLTMRESFLADIRRGDADALAIATDYLIDHGMELAQIADLLLPAVLQGYAGTPKEFLDGMPKDRLWEWMRRMQPEIGTWVKGKRGLFLFRWEAVRDMEIDWNSEIDWRRMRVDSRGAEIRLRDLKRRVLALFPEVRVECPLCEGKRIIPADPRRAHLITGGPMVCPQCLARGTISAPDLIPPEPQQKGTIA